MSGYPMKVVELLAGESQQHDRLLGGAAGEYSVAIADKLVKSGPGIFYGVLVTTSPLGAGVINIRDSIDTTGNVLMTVPASAPVGSIYVLPVGILFNAGLHVDFVSTGSITVLYV